MSKGINLLDVPLEVRLRVYDHLFMNQTIKIEPDEPQQIVEETPYRMKRVPISAQLIRICHAIYKEAHHQLYSSNTFNCSSREGLKLFLQEIGPKNFSLIKHVIIDWEQLQDFAWSLAKEEYRNAFEGLQVVELATWRMRVLGGSSFLWREVKSYERQLCQSALEVCQKHKKLKVIAQRTYHRSGRVGAPNARVKWRFVHSEDDVLDVETIIPIEAELAQLKAGQDSESDRGALRMIDPF